MERGSVRTRSGDVYKPSVIRGYATSLRLRLLPALGARKLGDISRRDVQRLVDGWLEESHRREHDPQLAHAVARHLPARSAGWPRRALAL